MTTLRNHHRLMISSPGAPLLQHAPSRMNWRPRPLVDLAPQTGPTEGLVPGEGEDDARGSYGTALAHEDLGADADGEVSLRTGSV
ncbi:hypothetical protein DL769_009998 [Monosporascus sp. CRB-8-3]|nr:hypothetical protein DL769_009998 [Monosporascus sp. CRB-8-3]